MLSPSNPPDRAIVEELVVARVAGDDFGLEEGCEPMLGD